MADSGRLFYGLLPIGSDAPAAAGDFESIATITVGAGGASSIEFTSIPGTYQHLQVRVVARSTASDTNNDMRMQVNSDTGSNYAYHLLDGNGSSASAFGLASQSNPTVIYRAMTAANATASVFGASIIEILDYASTSKTKTARGLGGHDRNGAGVISLNSVLWNSTSAITSIKLTTSASNFAQHSTAALYGIRS